MQNKRTEEVEERKEKDEGGATLVRERRRKEIKCRPGT